MSGRPVWFFKEWKVAKATNARAGLVGFMHGRGFMATEIARALGNQVGAESVRGWIKAWGLPARLPRQTAFVPVTAFCRQKLRAEAERRNMSVFDLASAIVGAAVRDDLYSAVTDGRYDRQDALAEQERAEALRERKKAARKRKARQPAPEQPLRLNGKERAEARKLERRLFRGVSAKTR